MADGKSEISGTGGGPRRDLSLGKLLTEARKNGGFTSEQVAAETHIPSHYIKAIETDDYGMISDQLYLLPFVRRYAAFIGLDPEDVASRFVREVQKAESSAGKTSEPMPMIADERKSGGGRYGFAIVVLLVLAGLAALVTWKREALMQHVLHFSKRTPFSTEPAVSPSSPPAPSVAVAPSRAAAQAPESAQPMPSDSNVAPEPESESSPAAEQTAPSSDDSHSVE